MFAKFPEQQQTIIILTNNGADDSVDENAQSLNDILDGRAAVPAKPMLSKALYPLLIKSELDKASALTKQANSTQDSAFLVEERMMNRLGYTLLQQGKMAEGIFALAFNHETFSNSPNTYDSLAEAYAMNGNMVRATTTLNQMKAKFPQHTDFAKRLAELKEVSDKSAQ